MSDDYDEKDEEKRDPAVVLSKFEKKLAAALRPHGARVERYLDADKVWHAVLEAKDSDWESDLAPPYALQIAETYLSNLVVDLPRQRVRPRTQAGEASAPSLESLITYQHKVDHFDEKWMAFCQQGVIRPLTAAKIAWRQEVRKVRKRNFQAVPMVPIPVETEPTWDVVVTQDQPTMTVIDVCQLFWDPGATSLDEASYVMWRDYVSLAELEDMAEAGIYENVDELERCDQVPRLDGDPDSGRDLKGRVEVIEWWCREENRLIVVANRQVVLRDEPNPLGHADLPFVVASVIPVPFSIVGKSIVELCADHQAALWDLANQRLDNTRFMANAAWRVDPSVDQKIESIHPGAIINARQGTIENISPDVSILSPSIQAEQAIRQDMADVTGVTPYVSGTSSGQVDQTTATGIQLLQNMAQQRILMGRMRLMGALERIGRQWIILNQQLLPYGTAVRVTDQPTAEWLTIDPAAIQGQYDYEVENVVESINTAQKRQEALTKLQVLTSVAPLLQGSPFMLDIPELVRDVTEAFNERPDKYLAAAPPPMPAAPLGLVPPDPGGLAAPGAAPGTPPPGAAAPPNGAVA